MKKTLLAMAIIFGVGLPLISIETAKATDNKAEQVSASFSRAFQTNTSERPAPRADTPACRDPLTDMVNHTFWRSGKTGF